MFRVFSWYAPDFSAQSNNASDYWHLLNFGIEIKGVKFTIATIVVIRNKREVSCTIKIGEAYNGACLSWMLFWNRPLTCHHTLILLWQLGCEATVMLQQCSCSWTYLTYNTWRWWKLTSCAMVPVNTEQMPPHPVAIAIPSPTGRLNPWKWQPEFSFTVSLCRFSMPQNSSVQRNS